MIRYCVLVAVFLVSSACVHKPLETNLVTMDIAPVEVTANASGDEDAQGGVVLWGGVILSSENLATGTQIEVLSYPLDHLQRPDSRRTATGRFLIVHPDYLETLDYAPGRLLTLTGTLAGTETGKIGSADYQFVKLVPDQVYLWSRSGEDHSPPITFGIGISISN